MFGGRAGSGHRIAHLATVESPPGNRLEGAFAEKIGWTKARVNELVRGKRGVTAEAALDLADTLGTSPKLWMSLQATYDLDRAKKARDAA
jgi:antitoxin HigA-1